MDLIHIIFGMKVRQARLEAGLTLTDLARMAEMSPSYLTEIEKGRKYPRADKIVKMAEALGKPYDDLVSIRPVSYTHLTWGNRDEDLAGGERGRLRSENCWPKRRPYRRRGGHQWGLGSASSQQ